MLKKLTKDDLKKNWEKQNPPAASVREAKTDEAENALVAKELKLEDKFTDAQIELLFPPKALSAIRTTDLKATYTSWYGDEKNNKARGEILQVLKKLRVHAVKSYAVVKDRQVHTFKSTPEYPVFLIDEGQFKLIYQPLHADPKCVYTYYGDRPVNYLHGRTQALAEYQKQFEDHADEVTKKPGRKKKGEEAPPPAEKKKIVKLNHIILVPEPADAFGLALMGYFTVFFGGHIHQLQKWDMIELSKICENICQVRNNTEFGHASAHERALEHLDLVTIELPEHIETVNDKGWQEPQKITNIRDYLTWQTRHDFKDLLEDSMPYRFWDSNFGSHDFSNTRVYNFLNKMGFYRLPIEGEKNEYVYVRLDGNVVRKTNANKVKNFVTGFLRDRRVDHALRDFVYKSTQLSEGSLSNLDETTIDFSDHDHKRQFMFFRNGTYEVSAEGITMHEAGKIKRYVWDTDVIEHDIAPAGSPFRITFNPAIKQYDIEVLHYNCLFFNYLIQSSRVHWRTEYETGEKAMAMTEEERRVYRAEHKFDIAGPNLSDEERFEQKQHLINKIYTLGYLQHRHKNRSQSWAVVAVDNNTPADGKSYGGTGKSICFNQALVKVVKNFHSIPGTNPKVTDNPHIFHGLNKHHRVLIIDDAAPNLNFRFFFEYITGNQVVNPKNNTPFTIMFEDLAKLVWLTNFTFRTDPSTRRRIIYTAFSDLYHAQNDEAGYKEAYEPKDDFGKELFSEFDDREYNFFYNTMAYCLNFYLSCPTKLNAPMNNVEKRNLQAEMGQHLEEWATLFFDEISENTDRLLIRSEIYAEFLKESGFTPKTFPPQRFKSGIAAFCRYHGYEFNPAELHNTKDKRILHAVQTKTMTNSGWDIAKAKTEECFYIRTIFTEGVPLNKEVPSRITFTKDK